MHNEYWNDTKRPIGYTWQRRVAIERIDNDFGGYAVAFTTAELFPEEGNRPTLEGEDEEEVHTVYLDGKQGSPKNDAMGFPLGYAQQKDTDAGFEKDVRDNVGRFAGPPPLLQVNINAR